VVGLTKAFVSREPARAAPGGERRANGAGREDVDELIASLAESVGLSDETPAPSRAARRGSRRVRVARPRIRPGIQLVSLEVALYIAAAIALGAVIGFLAPRFVP
jgi:hypothetical protein